MKEDPHFCFLLPAKEEREVCFTSVASRGAGSVSRMCVLWFRKGLFGDY